MASRKIIVGATALTAASLGGVAYGCTNGAGGELVDAFGTPSPFNRGAQLLRQTLPDAPPPPQQKAVPAAGAPAKPRPSAPKAGRGPSSTIHITRITGAERERLERERRAKEERQRQEAEEAKRRAEARRKTLYADENKALWSDPKYGDDDYGLDVYACAKTLFHGAAMPNNRKRPLEEKAGARVGAPINNGPDPSLFTGTKLKHGCLLMHMRTGNGELRFRSEMVIKNEKVGVVLWTGVTRDTFNYSDAKLKILINYRVAFYVHDPDQNQWNIDSAYSMTKGTSAFLPNLESVKVEWPRLGGEEEYVASIDDVKSKTVREKTFGGLLTTFGGRYAGLHVAGADAFYGAKAADKRLTLNMFSILGYFGADAFHYSLGTRPGGTWDWKRLKGENGADFKANVKSTLELWINPFSEYQQWGQLRDFCPGITTKKSDPSHMDNVCFEGTAPKSVSPGP